jgi:hypothetical protein
MTVVCRRPFVTCNRDLAQFALSALPYLNTKPWLKVWPDLHLCV